MAQAPQLDEVPLLEKDDAFHLLQSARRRAALRYLFERADDDRVPMREVAEAVAAWEQETTVDRLRSGDRQRVYIALYQAHLPTLDDAGVVDYDQDRGVVELRPLARVLEPYLADGLHAPDADELAVEEPSGDGDGRSGLSGLLTALRSD